MTHWPSKPEAVKPNFTAALLAPPAGTADAARAAAFVAAGAATRAADAALAGRELPTLADSAAAKETAAATARAAARGEAANASAAPRRGAAAGSRAADAVAGNGTSLKSDAAAAAPQKLAAAADAVEAAALVVGHTPDARAAEKVPRHTLTVVVVLHLSGEFVDVAGVQVDPSDGPAVAGRRRRRLARSTVPAPLSSVDAAALEAAVPRLANLTATPDAFIDPRLVDAAGVRDAVLSLLHARLGALGARAAPAAASLAASVDAVDTEGAVYAVETRFRGDSVTAAALANAVNDVSPRDACQSWVNRVGYNFCAAVAGATPLVVVEVQVCEREMGRRERERACARAPRAVLSRAPTPPCPLPLPPSPFPGARRFCRHNRHPLSGHPAGASVRRPPLICSVLRINDQRRFLVP